MTTGGLRAYINEQWRAGPWVVCQQAIAGRFPVAPDSTQDIRLEDFGEFFGYGGTMDQFFNEHLRQYVDSTASTWRVRPTGNVPLALSADALSAFQAADNIKRTFFRQGSPQPSVTFNLRPLEMDTSLGRFYMNVEGQDVEYEFGRQGFQFIQWASRIH